MNKAKVILSALAIFAVVGGALAFKANRALFPLYYTYTTTTEPGGDPITTCTLSPYNSTIGLTVARPVGVTFYTTKIVNTCSVIYEGQLRTTVE